MDMTDPRLQLSDLTDYQYQTSLAQQYNAYSSNGSAANHVSGYFQTVPQDESRAPALTSSQQLHSRSHQPSTRNQPSTQDFDLQALYQRTSIPDAARGYNVGSASSMVTAHSVNNNLRAPNKATRQTHNAGSSATSSVTGQPSDKMDDIKDPTTFVPPHLLAPLKPNPPSLKQWREKFFNIDEPLLLTSEEYLTYFPHVDNVYSHRSTQKYKRKPFVSHYWDCRLKGRPTGTPMNKSKKADTNGAEPEPKKRKRKVRERDLCDVKIKITEYFGTEELEALRKLGLGPEPSTNADDDNGDLTFVLEGHQSRNDINDPTFGVLEPAQHHPPGHPGAGGKKWYLVQRVSGNDREGDEGDGRDLDHKHTLEESDRIKKNSVQRWLLAQAKEKKKAAKADPRFTQIDDDSENEEGTSSSDSQQSRLHASGLALQTLHTHSDPTENQLSFYACSYCPFSQRVWIALELIGIPYRYIEATEKNFALSSTNAVGMRATFPELNDINPEGKVPCLKHNNFAVWESAIMMEYLEDLGAGHSLFAPAESNPQFKAHSRLWVDFIDRRILPVFYALLLLPDTDVDETQNTIPNLVLRDARSQQDSLLSNRAAPDMAMSSSYTYMPKPHENQCDISSLPPGIVHANYRNPQTALRAQALIATLHSTITTLVNASHREGPFFLGPTLSYVDIAFAPWIIRLSRVLSYYRGFPRPEVGTRWRAWCDAVENNDIVKRTVSEEEGYREVYGSGIRTGTTPNGHSNGHGGHEESHGWQYDAQGRVDWDDARTRNVAFPEMKLARQLVETEGFGLGGDIWGKIAGEDMRM